MSDFDKKIKNKLDNHESSYREGAWDEFKTRLPVAWYATWLKTLLPWTIAAASLGLWLWDKEDVQKVQNAEVVYRTDTLYISSRDTLVLEKIKPIYVYVPNNPPNFSGNDIQNNEDQSIGKIENILLENKKLANKELVDAVNAAPEQRETQEKEERISKESQEKGVILAEIKKDKDLLKEEEQAPKAALDDTTSTVIEKEMPQKKKLILPTMRFGVGMDVIGLGILTAGPTTEIFLNNKLSLSLGLFFSGQQVVSHALERDFNKKTGKRFLEEYGRFLPNSPSRVQNIEISTSFVRMPLGLNYYIPTYKKLGFFVSAGTRLDIGVYQDINFLSGEINDQILRRFEARPRPRVFNNMYYGTGLQYKHRNVVAQIWPYFEYRFRSPEYFAPPRNVGLSGSLKIEF